MTVQCKLVGGIVRVVLLVRGARQNGFWAGCGAVAVHWREAEKKQEFLQDGQDVLVWQFRRAHHGERDECCRGDGGPRRPGVMSRKSGASVSVSQENLGIMANASRKQVNSAMKRFAQAGWVDIGYRTITITNAPALRR